MNKEELNDIKGKRAFVKALSGALKLCRNVSIKSVDLELYVKGKHTMEYIVVTFSNGAKSVRNASINNDSANMQEIARMVNGGYYEELDEYRNNTHHMSKVDLDVTVDEQIQRCRQNIRDIEEFDDVEYNEDGCPGCIAHGGLEIERLKSFINELMKMKEE